MTRACVACILCALPGAVAKGDTLFPFFGESTPPFLHSSGLYAFLPPGGWSCGQARDASVVCDTSNGSAPGRMLISDRVVEGKLDAELMALNAERELKKLKHYRKLGGARVLLGENKAAIRSFSYDHFGNVEYPAAVEELYVVSGGRAIHLRFETAAAALPSYAADLRRVYDTLGLAKVSPRGQILEPARARNSGPSASAAKR